MTEGPAHYRQSKLPVRVSKEDDLQSYYRKNNSGKKKKDHTVRYC